MNANWIEPSGRRMYLGPAELHIWRIALWPEMICPETFSDQETVRAARFRTEQARQRYISSNVDMRDVLSRYLQTSPAQISIRQQGTEKPRLAATSGTCNVSFNLSRCGDLALMTLAASVQVGVDIECLIPERYEPGMEDLVLTSNEKAALAAIDPADRWRAFLCGWTRKEAYAKCIGLGLSADLTNVELGLTEESIQVEGIVVTSFVPQQGFLAAWAAESALSPSFWNWTP